MLILYITAVAFAVGGGLVLAIDTILTRTKR